MMKKCEYGRSMIEMMGVLAIIGILTVGGFSMITKMNDSRKASAVIDEIADLALKVRTVARDYEEPSDSDCKFSCYICNAKAYPSNLEYKGIDSTTKKCNSESYFVGTDDVNYTLDYVYNPNGEGENKNLNLFEIKIEKATTEMCVQIATTGWGTVGTSGFKSIKIGEGNIKEAPYSIGEASNDCGDGKAPIITLSFR